MYVYPAYLLYGCLSHETCREKAKAGDALRPWFILVGSSTFRPFQRTSFLQNFESTKHCIVPCLFQEMMCLQSWECEFSLKTNLWGPASIMLIAIFAVLLVGEMLCLFADGKPFPEVKVLNKVPKKSLFEQMEIIFAMFSRIASPTPRLDVGPHLAFCYTSHLGLLQRCTY